MGRLIDADALIELLRSNMSNDIQDQIITENNINLIESMPTAFVIEKVVAELEKATQYVDLSNPSSPIRHEVKAIHPRVAIEIVRRGGAK